jgi:ATP-binding cassette, subfamily C, type I secretion system permease/ATPase
MKPETDLRRALRACRGAGLFLVAFSFGINLLALASPLYMMQLYDRVVSSRSVDTLIMLTIAFTGAIAALVVLDALRGQVLARLGVWLDDRVGPSVIAAGLRATLAGGGAGPGGEAMRDLGTLRGFLSGPSTTPLMDAPWAPLFLVLLFVLHPLLGVVGLGSSLFLFGLALLNEAATNQPFQRSNSAAMRSMRALEAAFRNAEVIETMGMRDGILKLWQRSGEAAKDAQRIAGQRAAIIQALSRFARIFVQSAIMGAGAWLVIDDHASPGIMFGASFLIVRALAPVENAILTWRSVVSARLAYRRLQRLLETMSPVPKAMPLPRPQGHLSVEGLVYTPPGAEAPVLRGISLALEPGQILGIIGPSAAGKTTLARCITGAWRPSAGHVRLDGADIGVWLASEAGEHIGYLPQDVELFAGAVRDNISRLGDAEPARVIEAAKMVGLHETIMRLPKGYDTDIGEGGVKLSGGQRQRVGLARALFGDPRLVVLDEPNSSLDSEGEAALVDAIAQLKERGATVIVIAHRPSILQHADKVLILRNGAIHAFGNRADVLGKLNLAATGPAPEPPRELVAAMVKRVYAGLAAGPRPDPTDQKSPA